MFDLHIFIYIRAGSISLRMSPCVFEIASSRLALGRSSFFVMGAAGAQPRAGHLHINPGEANGPKRERAPLPGGRRVHLGSVCWVGRWCAMSCRHSPRGVGGRASGGSSLLVSRAAAAPFIWSLVLYFRFCIVSRPLASRGAPERHVYCCWLRVRNGYTRTPSGGTLGACATRQGGVGGGRASSPERLAARSRGMKTRSSPG